MGTLEIVGLIGIGAVIGAILCKGYHLHKEGEEKRKREKEEAERNRG